MTQYEKQVQEWSQPELLEFLQHKGFTTLGGQIKLPYLTYRFTTKQLRAMDTLCNNFNYEGLWRNWQTRET